MKSVELKGRIFFDPDHKTKKHEKQGDWKKTAMIVLNDDTTEFYSWFIKRRYSLTLNKPLRGAHITIINDKITDQDVLKKYENIKKKYHGKQVTFSYDVNIRANEEYWWLKVQSDEAQAIRDEAGLGEPYYGFHLTVGYPNEKNIDHHLYILKGIRDSWIQ